MKLRPPLRYRCLARVLSPVFTLHAALRARRDGGWRYWHERRGFGGPSHATLWVHAASVGEVKTVWPLVRERLDTERILCTTVTPTGYAVLSGLISDLEVEQRTRIEHRYLPMDSAAATRRFLARHSFDQGWIVETEIWPWLYARCAASDRTLTIINGRVSERTARHVDGYWAPVYQRALTPVRVLSRSDHDAQTFIALGAHDVQVAGDLKLAGEVPRHATETPCPDRTFVLAASTHADEEVSLLRAWLALARDELLVLVPRHVERADLLARELNEVLSAAGHPTITRRSRAEQPTNADPVHLGDTVGELDLWYAHTSVAFIGGSLAKHGGHNLVEAARHGVALISGPHLENFSAQRDGLLSVQALQVAHSAEAVVAFLKQMLDVPEQAASRGEHAQRWAERQRQDALERYQALL